MPVLKVWASALWATMLLSSAAATALPIEAAQSFEVTTSYETKSQTSDGSSGRSNGRESYLERLVATHNGGIETEYDMPLSATAEERARNWQLPARVFKSADGKSVLLNVGQLEARLEQWLKAASWDRSMCDRWIFTWYAFLVDCDPQSVLKLIEQVDLGSIDARDGALISNPLAAAPGRLVKKAEASDDVAFGAALTVDPDAVRRRRAEADVVSGALAGTPVTLETALGKRATEQVAGTIVVTLEADKAGTVLKRTTVTKIEVKGVDGETESQTETRVVERRPVRNVNADR